MTSTKRDRNRLAFGSKKGNAILDTMTVLIVVVVFVFISIFSYKAWTDIEPDLMDEMNESEEATQVVEDTTERMPKVMDGLIVFCLLLLWGVVIVASFMVDSHPIFFIFMIILLVAVVIAMMYISNTYIEIMEDDELAGLTAHFPMTHFIMSNLLVFSIVIGLSVAFVLYGKYR